MSQSPKLVPDAIVESLLEIRFATDEVPEIVVGKLASLPIWSAFVAISLPASQIPAGLRRIDPNMQFAPTLERTSDDGKTIARLGEKVLSFHRKAPYPGWHVFGPELNNIYEMIFGAGLTNFKIIRLGLRYLNAFTKEDHDIEGINDLNLKVSIAGKQTSDPFVLMLRHSEDGDVQADVRIASKALLTNPEPPNQTAYLDLDFHTPDNFLCSDVRTAADWTSRAHKHLDDLFLTLLTQKTQEKLLVK